MDSGQPSHDDTTGRSGRVEPVAAWGRALRTVALGRYLLVTFSAAEPGRPLQATVGLTSSAPEVLCPLDEAIADGLLRLEVRRGQRRAAARLAPLPTGRRTRRVVDGRLSASVVFAVDGRPSATPGEDGWLLVLGTLAPELSGGVQLSFLGRLHAPWLERTQLWTRPSAHSLAEQP